MAFQYRYPTSIHWGPGYRDGFREIEAANDGAALALARKKCRSTDMRHMQIHMRGCWRNVNKWRAYIAEMQAMIDESENRAFPSAYRGEA